MGEVQIVRGGQARYYLVRQGAVFAQTYTLGDAEFLLVAIKALEEKERAELEDR